MGKDLQLDAKEYFASRSEVKKSGCIEWTGPLKGAGYGQSPQRFGGGRYAHRAMYEACIGPIPNGLCVLHRCDNAKCINLDHLFIGSQLENVLDMHKKARQRGGSMPNEKNPNCRISNRVVSAMRYAYSLGMPIRKISEIYEVDKAHCVRIVSNQSRILVEAA